MSRNLIPPAKLKEKGITYSRPHLYRLEHDGKFPKRVPIGPCRYGYVEEEIDAYVDALIEARDTGAKPATRKVGTKRAPAADVM